MHTHPPVVEIVVCEICAPYSPASREILHHLHRLDTAMSALSDAIATLQATDTQFADDLAKFEADVTQALADLQAKANAGGVQPGDLAALQAIVDADKATDTSITNGDAAAVAADPGAPAPVDTPPAA